MVCSKVLHHSTTPTKHDGRHHRQQNIFQLHDGRREEEATKTNERAGEVVENVSSPDDGNEIFERNVLKLTNHTFDGAF